MLEIRSNQVYSASELVNMIGKRTVERLRGHGMIALAGHYLGQNVLDAWIKAAESEWQCRRGLGKGEQIEETTQTKRMEEGYARRGVQPVSKPKPGVSLADQLERSRRKAA